jgi:hypothetical protein
MARGGIRLFAFDFEREVDSAAGGMAVRADFLMRFIDQRFKLIRRHRGQRHLPGDGNPQSSTFTGAQRRVPPSTRVPANSVCWESAGFAAGYGGEGGIRTHGALAGTPVFETGTIDHSVTSPWPTYL